MAQPMTLGECPVHNQTLPRGQAIPEFALSVVIILLLLLSILQFGLLYNAQIGLTNGVRDATRYGSSLTANTDATAMTQAAVTRAYLQSSLASHVAPYSAARLTSASQACYEGYTDVGAQSAVRVRVTAVYEHPLVVPLIGAIIDALDGAADGYFQLRSTTEMRVDNPADPPVFFIGPACSSV